MKTKDNFWIIVHSCRFGLTSYLVKSAKRPNKKRAMDIIGKDYDADRDGESIEIHHVKYIFDLDKS